MNALSFARPHSSYSHSQMDVDFSMFMDTSQDFESSPGGVVRWVASQSPNPALQALMNEAERDRRTRPSTPVHEPGSWTYPLASATSSTSLSTSAASPWRPSGHTFVDPSYLLPLSGSSSASSSSLASRATEPSVSRRGKPLSSAQRRPLASSTSSANQPPRHSARPRSSSHSDPSTKKERRTPPDEEPEAKAFVELLKGTFKTVDKNSMVKQASVREKKERELSLGSSVIDDRTGLDTHNLSALPLTKTSSASVIRPVKSSTKAPEISSSTAHKPEPRGRVLEKTASLGAPGVDHVSGKFTPTSLPSLNPNCNLKFAPAPRPPSRASSISNSNHPTAYMASPRESASDDRDSAMQEDITDLTETDTEWETPMSGPISRADTTMYMDLDDQDSDTGMDVLFFKPEPPPQTLVTASRPKPHPQLNTVPKSQSSQPVRLPGPTQRARPGPPPLGMRRAPQPQPSQYSSTQGSKSVTVPRFKPPLLSNPGGMTNKNESGMRSAATNSSRPPPARSSVTKVAVTKTATQTSQDPDSSFDVSFDVDADALEEAMKAYD